MDEITENKLQRKQNIHRLTFAIDKMSHLEFYQMLKDMKPWMYTADVYSILSKLENIAKNVENAVKSLCLLYFASDTRFVSEALEKCIEICVHHGMNRPCNGPFDYWNMFKVYWPGDVGPSRKMKLIGKHMIETHGFNSGRFEEEQINKDFFRYYFNITDLLGANSFKFSLPSMI